MIGQLIGLRDASCSRSTWLRRPEADNTQEQSVCVQAATEILVAVWSTSGARAPQDGLNGPVSCVSNAHREWVSRCSHAQPFGMLRSPSRLMRTFGLFGVHEARRCPCHWSQSRGIHSLGRYGLGCRFASARTLAWVCASVLTVVPCGPWI